MTTNKSAAKQDRTASFKHEGTGFNQASGSSNDNARGMAATDKTILKAQLLSAIKNRLPAFGAFDFTLEDEKISATQNQKTLVELIRNKDIVFVNGPIGSGKTFWTCLAALQGLAEKKFNKISLTAPAVEADEELGFLPGSADDKMAAHVNQIIETIEDLVGKKLCQNLREEGLIEIAAHAYNRGRTYKKTLYILDESQNASARQLITSLGRLGFGSTFVYMGDDRQNDRTAKASAYVSFTKRFNTTAYADAVGGITMGKEDVRRHPLLARIVANNDDRALDGFEGREDSKIGRKPNRKCSDEGPAIG